MPEEAGTEKEGSEVPATSAFSGKIFGYLPTNAQILDLGCGYGRIAGILLAKGYEVEGIDTNEAAIRQAQGDSALAGARFSVQDATHTEFPDKHFDAVIEQAALACMEEPDRHATLGEAWRILKPGGILSVAEFGIAPGETARYEKDAAVAGEYGTMIVRRDDGSEWFRSHNFRKDELEGLVRDAGFEVLSYEGGAFPTVKGKPHPGHFLVARKQP